MDDIRIRYSAGVRILSIVHFSKLSRSAEQAIGMLVRGYSALNHSLLLNCVTYPLYKQRPTKDI